MSPRVRRVLNLVDELELDPEEVSELLAELHARDICIVDLDACADEDDRDLALTIKRRLDAAARGETRTISMAQANAILRHRHKARRAAAR